ncbi:hypothetical protein POUND7_002609 [Theobroma cacao]
MALFSIVSFSPPNGPIASNKATLFHTSNLVGPALLPMIPRCSVARDHRIVSTPFEHFDYRSGHPTITDEFRIEHANKLEEFKRVFDRFKDKEGSFRNELRRDIKGLMELYEASQLAVEGEDILDGAREFSSQALKTWQSGELDQFSGRVIKTTLDQPYHKSLSRFTARNFLTNFKGTNEWINVLQELAKMDFNIVQSLHQTEVVRISNWWKGLGLTKELELARDQPLKWYIWSMASLTDPSLSEQRIDLTKPISLIYIIDDIFDIYGTLDELTLFTQAVDRAFLVEARWFASGKLPKAKEYLENGITSSGVHIILVHSFFLLGQGLNNKNVELIDNNPGMISSTATILRLWDDLGSAKDENQDANDGSYVECYMEEHQGVKVESARKHVTNMISNAWKRLNHECLSENPFSLPFARASLNIARMVPLMYSYDENQCLPSLEEYMKSLLYESVPMKNTSA